MPINVTLAARPVLIATGLVHIAIYRYLYYINAMAERRHMVVNPRFENLEPLLPVLEAVSRFCGEWQRDVRLEPAAVKSLKRMVIATSAGASTRIEGARLDNRQALEVVLGRKKLYEDRSAGEVLGYSEALDMTLRRNRPGAPVLTEAYIKRLHKKMTAFSPETMGGRYRLNEVNVTDGRGGIMLVCALPDLIPFFMKNAIRRLCRGWNSVDCSTLALIAEFIAEFLAIHPFEDGNGRCARLLTVLLLKQAGHDYLEYTSLEEQIEKYKLQYYISLNKAQKTGISDGWFGFCLMTLRQAQLALRRRLGKHAPEIKGGATALMREVLAVFSLKNVVPAGEIIRLTGKSPAGVRKALSGLVKKKLVLASGKNRGRIYRLNRPQ